MSRIDHYTRAFASPSRYIQGRYEVNNLKEYTKPYGDNVLIVVDTFFYKEYKDKFEKMYAGEGNVLVKEFSGEITVNKIGEYIDQVKDFNPQVVAGMGGGKTMDTAKAIANHYRAATVIIPTTASTDAPTIAISVIYNDAGEHIESRHLLKNPDVVLLDTDIISKAPIRFFASGMGDALSTYIEVRANLASHSPNYVGKGFCATLAVEALAKTCHETVLKKGVSAYNAAKAGLCTIDVEDVIEANTLLSGLGVQSGSCAGAHSIAEGLTVIPACAKLLHGEVVAYGNLVQLIVEGRPAEEIKELYDLYKEINLPYSFEKLGIPDVSKDELMAVAESSLHSYWDVEPFPVSKEMVYDGLVMADILGKKYNG